MLKTFLVMTMLLAVLSGAQAQADSYKRYDDSQRDAASDFTGPYVGGTVGYAFGSHDADTTIGGTTTGHDLGMDGFQGGLLAGYGFQFNPGAVSRLWDGFVGLEFGYEWSEVDGSAGGANIDKDDAFLVTLRPGLTWGYSKALGYGIIGYSRTQFETGADDEWLDGLVVGAGTELGTVGPLKTRLEYVYTNYEDTDLSLGGGNTVSLDGHDSVLKLGAVARF